MDILRASIDIEKLYDSTKANIDEIIAQQDYNKLMGIFNRKSLHKRISKELGLANTENDNYAQFVLRLLNTDKKKQIIKEMAQYTPTIK